MVLYWDIIGISGGEVLMETNHTPNIDTPTNHPIWKNDEESSLTGKLGDFMVL